MNEPGNEPTVHNDRIADHEGGALKQFS